MGTWVAAIYRIQCVAILGLRKRVGNRKGFLTRFVGYRYNVEGRSVKDFLRDPAIDVSFK